MDAARRILDVSLSIQAGMLSWPSDPGIELERVKRLEEGDPSNVSELRLGTHTGTHVDPPAHFIEGGAGVDALPLDVLVGEAVVVHAGDARGALDGRELHAMGVPDGARRVLIRSRNSELWREPAPRFPEEYVCLSPDGARWVVERGIELVGVDFLSVEAQHAEGHPVHRTLLGNGVVVVEGLDLGAVAPGRYTLVCLPLRLAGGDGAPARVLLLR